MASLQEIMKNKATAMALSNHSVASVQIDTLENVENQIAAYSGDESEASSNDVAIAANSGTTGENWIKSNNYLWYDEYSDENLSYIDENKNITIDPSQVNLTQESFSQFIPFQMSRYYDGVDLTSKSLQIMFENSKGGSSIEVPVNVKYNNDKIRFGWLVSDNATAVAGNVKIEIQAIGRTSKGDNYLFKTRSNGFINIEKSLSGNGVIEPDMSWTNSFILLMNDKISEAQTASKEALSAAERAEESANMAVQAAEDSKVTINEAKEELGLSVSDAVNEKVKTALLDYYTKSEVDTLINNVDISSQLDEVRGEITTLDEKIQGQISTIQTELDDVVTQIENLDGLAKFDVEYDGKTMTFYNGETVMKEIEINSDPSLEWTTAYSAQVDEKISIAVTGVQESLDTYKAATDADLSSIHEAIDGLPETLESDYYTKTASDEKFATKTDLASTNQNVSVLSSSIETNKTNISTVSEKLIELQEEVNAIDKSPRVTYDFDYNNPEDPNGGENKFVVYKVENEGLENETRELQEVFTIQGGSGGGGGSVLKIEYVTASPIVATINDKVEIKFNFSGTDSSGDQIMDGQATWKVGSTIVATNLVTAGENTFDVTEYLTVGTQKVLLSITDDNGSLTTKTWTVQKLDVRLESDFNDKLTYPLGTIALSYTPFGAISKDIHFILDGEEIGTVTSAASGIPMGYTLPEQTHGSHLLEVYMTATINNNDIESNRILKDIIWYDETSKIPVIGCTQTNIKALQYDTTNIEYTVYDPTTESPKVTLAVDGEVVSTLTMEKNTDTWQFKSSEVGNHVLTITCGETVKTINVEVEKLDITVEPVTAGLVIDFNPVGKSNSDTDRVWSNENYAMSVSDNFD